MRPILTYTKKPPHTRRMALPFLMLVVGLMFLGAVAALLWREPDYKRFARHAHTRCRAHLSEIHEALHRYQKDKGFFPREVAELLYGGYLSGPQVLVCPASNRMPVAGINVDEWKMNWTADDTSYKLLSANSVDGVPACPTIIELEDSHKDGHVFTVLPDGTICSRALPTTRVD